MKIDKFLIYFLTLILLSLTASLIQGNYNIKHYDKNVIAENGQSTHLMIKNDSFRYFSHGHEIKQQLDQDVNYFDTGRVNFTKYLFPRIIALYYKVFDLKLYENNEEKIVNLGIHKNYLFFQILIYYFSILYLYFQLKNKIANKFLFFSIFFLCLEPTLFQYHSTFWSESIFFSLQILIMSLILNDNSSNLKLFLIGVLLSFLALQRTNGFYYLIPILLFFFFSKETYFLKKISFLLIGFISIMTIVGYHNYKKSDRFFVIPTETKSVLSAYVVPNILNEKEMNEEKNRFVSFLKTSNFTLDFELLDNFSYQRYSFIFCSNLSEKNDELENYLICDYFDNRSKEILLSHPLKTVKYVIRKSLSFALLNPFHIYTDHKFLSGEEYYRSDLHKKLLPYRIVYTLIIFLICFFGLMHMIRLKNYKIMFYLLISGFYFFSILSWHGNNRYFTPVLVYASFFFGYGIISILNFLSISNKSN
tara:strand:+ start:325 stop:1752 length:1428 start_codon:yes stop_codon:yes gene_type:complete